MSGLVFPFLVRHNSPKELYDDFPIKLIGGTGFASYQGGA